MLLHALDARPDRRAIGPTCAEALGPGITPHVVPDPPKMGPLLWPLDAPLRDSAAREHDHGDPKDEHDRPETGPGHLPTLIASFLHFDLSFMLWVLLGALGIFIAESVGLSPAEKGLWSPCRS